MRIADGKSILNGIAIGKLRIYRGCGFRLSLERGVSPREETARFELALQRVDKQQLPDRPQKATQNPLSLFLC